MDSMKHIRHENYILMQDSLCEHIDMQKDPYKYLYRLVNGCEWGEHGPIKSKRRITLKTIKEIWDSHTLYKKMVRLAIICHYKGNIVDVSEGNAVYVTNDFIIRFKDNLIRQYKEEKMKANYYGSAIIKGTLKQYDKILSKYPFKKDGKQQDIQYGISRIRKGFLVLEITGWGEEICLMEDAAEFARKDGCEVYTMMCDGYCYPSEKGPDDFYSASSENWKDYWDVNGYLVSLKPEFQ